MKAAHFFKKTWGAGASTLDARRQVNEMWIEGADLKPILAFLS